MVGHPHVRPGEHEPHAREAPEVREEVGGGRGRHVLRHVEAEHLHHPAANNPVRRSRELQVYRKLVGARLSLRGRPIYRNNADLSQHCFRSTRVFDLKNELGLSSPNQGSFLSLQRTQSKARVQLAGSGCETSSVCTFFLGLVGFNELS